MSLALRLEVVVSLALSKGGGFYGAMWEAAVDVCRGSLVRAQVGTRRGTEAKLLHLFLNFSFSLI